MLDPLGYVQLSPTAATGLYLTTGDVEDCTDDEDPIVIESTAHGLTDGEVVIVEGVGGNDAANGVFVVADADENTFALTTDGSTPVEGDGAYTSGGTWRHLPAGAQVALLTAEAQHVRYRDDGTDPDGSTGQLIKTTDPPLLYQGDLQAIKFIEDASGGKLNVAFYREY